MIKNILIKFYFFTFYFFICINIVFAKGFGLDFGINSKYEADSKRSSGNTNTSGSADLEGSDLRIYYQKDDNLGFGLRLGNHSGNDSKGLCCGASYKINISENSLFAKYGSKLNSDREFLVEGYAIGGLNFAKMSVSHDLLESNSASTTGIMLEGGIFAGIKSDDVLFGGALSLPIDGYEGNFSWNYMGYNIDYDVTIKKSISLFLVLKSKI